MRDEHIIEMLERGPLSELDEGELAAVRAHGARCEACARAYEAARLSALMLRERAAERFEPSPFFQTRVMAALRERRAGKESWSLARLWRAAGALVSSMALTVAALAALTFLGPAAADAPSDAPDIAAVSETYPAEELLLQPDEVSENEMTYEQVLSTIYEAGE
ncbi:MAG TPA: hypothetical protein VGX48_22735 [Pyrinomonadaceae bacterium]|jgi:anti-sigma factor RsiW|nr:hypothetical protein [Pyrinomonadaceae bacterium]